MKRKNMTINLFIHLFFVVVCLAFVIPMLYVVSVSFMTQAEIDATGYQLIPKEFSLEAYQYVFRNPTQLLDSYQVTIFTSLVGTFLSVLVMAMVAYPLSRSTFYYKKPVTYYIFFTMLFSGGLIPSYIINTQYLHLGNNILIYILPSLVSAYNVIIIRTFFQGLPTSLVESAKLDGASEVRIFTSIILPLSKPVIATIALMTLLAKWNDWNTSLIYIRNEKLFSLQYMLQKILREVEFLKSMADSQLGLNITLENAVPTEPARFAMVIMAAGPMLVIFPFFQKYFTRGLTIGAVKG